MFDSKVPLGRTKPPRGSSAADLERRSKSNAPAITKNFLFNNRASSGSKIIEDFQDVLSDTKERYSVKALSREDAAALDKFVKGANESNSSVENPEDDAELLSAEQLHDLHKKILARTDDVFSILHEEIESFGQNFDISTRSTIVWDFFSTLAFSGMDGSRPHLLELLCQSFDGTNQGLTPKTAIKSIVKSTIGTPPPPSPTKAGPTTAHRKTVAAIADTSKRSLSIDDFFTSRKDVMRGKSKFSSTLVLILEQKDKLDLKIPRDYSHEERCLLIQGISQLMLEFTVESVMKIMLSKQKNTANFWRKLCAFCLLPGRSQNLRKKVVYGSGVTTEITSTEEITSRGSDDDYASGFLTAYRKLTANQDSILSSNKVPVAAVAVAFVESPHRFADHEELKEESLETLLEPVWKRFKLDYKKSQGIEFPHM